VGGAAAGEPGRARGRRGGHDRGVAREGARSCRDRVERRDWGRTGTTAGEGAHNRLGGHGRRGGCARPPGSGRVTRRIRGREAGSERSTDEGRGRGDGQAREDNPPTRGGEGAAARPGRTVGGWRLGGGGGKIFSSISYWKP
jgi:hypothetical protein